MLDLKENVRPCNIGTPLEENDHSYRRLYPRGLSTPDNSPLNYAFYSPCEKAGVASSLECGQSMKANTLLIAKLAHTVKLHLDSICLMIVRLGLLNI